MATQFKDFLLRGFRGLPGVAKGRNCSCCACCCFIGASTVVAMKRTAPSVISCTGINRAAVVVSAGVAVVASILTPQVQLASGSGISCTTGIPRLGLYHQVNNPNKE